MDAISSSNRLTSTIVGLKYPPTIFRSLRMPPADFADRTQGTCSYYPPDEDGCRAPRNCYDCLNAELEKESAGCMINDIGQCISVVDSYDFSLNLVSVVPVQGKVGAYHNKRLSDNVSEKTQPPRRRRTSRQMLEIQFSAENTTYCEDDDVLFNKDQLIDVGFGYGTEGCVLVEVCELPSWEDAVGGSDCSQINLVDFEDWSNGDSRDDESNSMFWCVAIAILLTLVATLTVIKLHYNRSKRRSEERQRRRIVVIAALIASSSRSTTPKCSKSDTRSLNLFGWKAMRANLIEDERCRNARDCI